MSNLTVEYREHKIRYNENSDTWTCVTLGVDAPTLRKAKWKVDALYRKLRSESALRCLMLQSHGYRSSKPGVGITEVTLVEYLGESRMSWGKSKDERDHSVAVVYLRPGNVQPSLQKEKLSYMALDNRATRQAIIRANALYKEAVAAVQRYDAAFAAIPRVTTEDISGLVEASQTVLEDDE